MISLGSSAPEKDRHVKPTGDECISSLVLPASGMQPARFTIVGQVSAFDPRCRVKNDWSVQGLEYLVAVL